MPVCGEHEGIIACRAEHFPPAGLDCERLRERASRELLRAFAEFHCGIPADSEVRRLLVGSRGMTTGFRCVHEVQPERLKPPVREPNAEAVAISPFIGFQLAAVEPLERLAWRSFLRR